MNKYVLGSYNMTSVRRLLSLLCQHRGAYKINDIMKNILVHVHMMVDDDRTTLNRMIL
jgi:hypothetical protein